VRSLKISIQQQDFSIEFECKALRSTHKDIGALATFTGQVRDINGSDTEHEMVESLYLEHYPGMTEKSLQDIVEAADVRWSILDVCIIHRIGELRTAEQIVFVAVTSQHRRDAFAACSFIMDFLKTSAPFWKKSKTQAGSHWVDAKDSDRQAVESWAEGSQKR
jgi:molybdopterin synthase catalytic subunit